VCQPDIEMGARRLTRRELIAGAGALAGAAGLLGAWAPGAGGPSTPPAPLPTPTPTPEPEPGLRKLIDIGPGGVIFPGSAQDYRYHSNPTYYADTRTRWIRMWADWPSLQPDPAYAIDDPGNPGRASLEALDDQIRRACADGLSFVLMPYRYPVWANGTAAVAAARGSDAEVSFQFWDRMTPRAWLRYQGSGRRVLVYDPRRAGLEYRLPDEGHGPQSAWARFFEFLYDRYHLGQRESGRYVRALELVNEPNLQLWPQQAPPIDGSRFAPTETTAPRAVADIMITAQAISARFDHSTLLLAPSLSDINAASGRRSTTYGQFAALLLDALDASGYRAHERQGWSHHNYGDVEYRTQAARTRDLMDQLHGRWQGRGLYVTEGGARVSRMAVLYPLEDPRAAQARCIQESWAAHAAAGVEMLAQYLLYDDVNFDSGLLEPFPSTLARPAYAVWKSL
jgi:hypothetical protein